MSQLAHWAIVQPQWDGAMEFVEYLNKRGIQLDFDDAKPGTPLDLRRLLNDCFDVDAAGLDRERRELLAKHERRERCPDGSYSKDSD